MMQKARSPRGLVAGITYVEEKKTSVLGAQRAGIVRLLGKRDVRLSEGVHWISCSRVVDLRDRTPA